ncbi:MAG: hypothetical protein JNL70_03135 [Saprospiraceae bacterium]|nr:hypothetical protein [Saprospiraceae bacterium]
MNMKSFIALFLSLFLVTHVWAQDLLTPRGNQYFFLGLGLPMVKVRDEGHSSLMYKGMNPTLRIGHERIGTDVVSRICFSFSAGQIKPSTSPKPEKQLSSADITTIEVSYAYYRRTKNAYDTEGWNKYIGGSVSLLFDGRNYNLPSNNVFGYQTNLSLNAGGYVHKKINNSWRINDELYTPILTFAMRPNYIGLMPMTTTDFSAKRMFKTGKIATVNKVFRLYNRLGFDQQINDHRQRRLAYTWDGQINRVSRPLSLVSAGLSYESLFKM